MLTTKISAVFLAAVLFAGAITVASPVLVDEAQASGEKKKDKKKYKDRYDGKERYYEKYRDYDREKYRDYDKRDRPYASDVQVNNNIYIECNLADDHGKNIDGQKRNGMMGIQSTDDLIEAMVNGGNGKNGKFGGPETIVDLESKFKDFCKIIDQGGKNKRGSSGSSGSSVGSSATEETQPETMTQIQQALDNKNVQCNIAEDNFIGNIGQDQEIKNKIEQILLAEDDIEIEEFLVEVINEVVSEVNFDCQLVDDQIT